MAPRYRALQTLQGPNFGLKRAGEVFEYVGSTIGWNVEPLNAEAVAQLEAQAAGRRAQPARESSPDFLPALPTIQSGMAARTIMTPVTADPPPGVGQPVQQPFSPTPSVGAPRRRPATPAEAILGQGDDATAPLAQLPAETNGNGDPLMPRVEPPQVLTPVVSNPESEI